MNRDGSRLMDLECQKWLFQFSTQLDGIAQLKMRPLPPLWGKDGMGGLNRLLYGIQNRLRNDRGVG